MKSTASAAPIRVLASHILTAILGFCMLILLLAGGILPQEGIHAPEALADWFNRAPRLSGALRAAGLFHVFTSLPFLIVTALLAVNLAACMVQRFRKAEAWPSGRLARVGSILMHSAVLGLMAGGVISGTLRFNGYVVLTEGQTSDGEPSSYLAADAGPLRKVGRVVSPLRLGSVETEHAADGTLIRCAASVEFEGEGAGRREGAIVEFNRPASSDGTSLTLDETGYSPGIAMARSGGSPFVDAFIALRTRRSGGRAEYSDFMPLHHGGHRVLFSLHPAAAVPESKDLLEAALYNAEGVLIARARLVQGESSRLGAYALAFTGLKRWASFKITHDPGYRVVVICLWVAVAGFVLRYAGDMPNWWRDDK